MDTTSTRDTRMRRSEFALLGLLVVGFAAAGLFRLNDLSLYTDSTRYLIWANSLAGGEGFLDPTSPEPTRFVMNAPLYPVLLVPSQLIASWSLTAAKVWTLLWGAAAVALFYFWMRRFFSPLASFCAAAFMALHPLYFVASTEVLSEAPFIALLLAALLTFEPLIGQEGRGRHLGVAAVVLILLPLVREVGFAFALAASIVLAHRKQIRPALAILGGAALLVIAWNIRNAFFLPELQAGQEANMEFLFGHFVTPQGESLAREFVTRLMLNVQGYAGTIGGAIFYPFPSNLIQDGSGLYGSLEGALNALKVVVLVVGGGLTLHGIILDLGKEGVGLFRPLALVFFLLIVLIYPVHEVRFLLPILPLVLAFIVRSMTDIGRRLLNNQASRRGLAIALTALLIAPNAVAVGELIETNRRYARSPETFAQGLIDSGESSPFYTRPWEQMGAWITNNVPAGSVIASPAKEIAPFAIGTAVLELSRSVPSPLFDRSLRDNAADFLLATTVWADFRSYEFAMDESRHFSFETLHRSGALTLFRIHRRVLPEAAPQAESLAVDSTAFTAPELLRLGRRHFLRLQYIEALGTLNEAARLAPTQAEITAQQILVTSVIGDVERSLALFEQLFTMPQSTPHVALAQAHLTLAEQLKLASEASSSAERSGRAIAAGRGYWDLGYGNLALRVMQNVLRLDSTSFDAALWACHFARQLGDTVMSRRYLALLKDIDFTAPIIRDIEAIDRAGARASHSEDQGDRLQALLELGELYEKLELFEEALDDLEKAMTLEPHDGRVRSAMVRIYERKGAQQALKRLASD